MKVTGTYEAFKLCWPSSINQQLPILYVVDASNRVSSIFPLAGFPTEWVIPIAFRPTEGTFLGTYGYAIQVDSVQP